MISNVESGSSYISVSQFSNVSTEKYYAKQNSDTGSIKFENDKLFYHNGIDYVPIFENTIIDLSPMVKTVLEWAQRKMFDEYEEQRLIKTYQEAKTASELKDTILKNLKAMEALIGKENIE